MFRKVYKVCFYILFILTLIAVVCAAAMCCIYGTQTKRSEYIFYGVLTLVLGVVLAFVLFAFTGMVIEAAEDLAAIREQIAPRKKKGAKRPAVQPNRPVQPVQNAAPVRPVQSVSPVQNTVPVQPVSPVQPVQSVQSVQNASPVQEVKEAAAAVEETVVETRKAAAEAEAVLEKAPSATEE